MSKIKKILNKINNYFIERKQLSKILGQIVF